MSRQYSTVQRDDAMSVRTEFGWPSRKRRYVRQDGSCNMAFRHIPEEWVHYVTDIFTTLIETRWRVMLLVFALSYILSWLGFGILFYVIALAHNDLKDLDNEPCMYEVRSFTAAFLFSLETQTTIGYGSRGMSETCMVAIILVTIQDVLSAFIDTFVIGIVVAKMASARKRAQTVGFTSHAVVNLRDGQLCLCWRVGDFRHNHMVEGTAHAQIIRHTVHTTGKVDVTYQDLHIHESNILLTIPVTVMHKIGPDSPLYRMSLFDLRRDSFELVVSFTYTDDSTGILHQTRTSYTPDDILWGHVFQEMIRVSRRNYKVDYALFNQTGKVHVPEVSAEEYHRAKHSPRLSSRNPSPSPRLSSRSPSLRLAKVIVPPPPELKVELVIGNESETDDNNKAGGSSSSMLKVEE
ncbi:inward rectifier potassium channel 16 [Engraulis encrasicolus]|uniref:inward rectifier potassium channel 16 n=1 Tax=Engraulis encrasicolus TaxID=184585 RepID=UPI002FD071C7